MAATHTIGLTTLFCRTCTLKIQTASHTSGTLDDSWIEAAIQSLSGLAVQPLDSELWGRTIGWADLQQKAAHLDSKAVDDKLKTFFEKVDGDFHCKIPANENGKDYCGKVLGRENRILSHVRDHLHYRPFNCDGKCGQKGCKEAFFALRYLETHIKPDLRNCPYCGESKQRQNIKLHISRCPKNPGRICS